MQLQTTRFGEITIDPELIFAFPGGLPGFPAEHRFALLSINLADTPFIWMQSVDNPALCFLLVDPQRTFDHYSPELTAADAQLLQCGPGAEMQVLCIVSVPDGDLRHATVNLKAPLWFHSQHRLALQAIADNESYSIRHPLFVKGGE